MYFFYPLYPGPIGLVNVIIAKMMGAAAVVVTGKSFQSLAACFFHMIQLTLSSSLLLLRGNCLGTSCLSLNALIVCLFGGNPDKHLILQDRQAGLLG